LSQLLSTTDTTMGFGLVPVRRYRPALLSSWTIVFAHGGGFSWGRLDDYDLIARRLCSATNAEVISVDYRLAPDYPFPCGLDDLCQVLREIGRERLVAVAGDSAGACLAASAAQFVRAEGLIRLDAQILIYPMIEYYDRTPDGFHTLAGRFHPSFDAIRGAWDSYLQAPVSVLPTYAVPPRGASLSALPPTLTIVAENDPLRFEGIAYAEILAAAGVTSSVLSYKGTEHGFLNEPSQQSVPAAMRDIGTWLAGVKP
jgi:acetyl esterase